MRRDRKKEILDATIALIEARGSDPSSITIRDICDAVGVGAGLVNYHFQTKENLVAQCVQVMVGDVIGRFDAIASTVADLAPAERLRFMAKSTCSYLVAHENMSRISILTDLTSGGPDDNTSQTVAAYLPLIRQACPDGMSEEELRRRTYLMVLTIQGLFLRSATLGDGVGGDFHDQQQRDDLVDAVIDLCLGR